MNAPSPVTVAKANVALAQDRDTGRTGVRSKSFTAAVMQKAHDLWRTNIRLFLSDFGDVHPRTVDHWEAGERVISMEAFLTLLDSDAGIEVLDIFMKQLRPEVRQQWFDQQVLLAKLERSERKKDRAEQENRQLRLRLELKR